MTLRLLRAAGILLLFAGILLLYALWLLQPIYLITADIGRYVMNGEIFLTDPAARWALLTTNFYTYTHPDFVIVNHHWLSGIPYALAHRAGGWNAVHLLSVAAGVAALGFFLDAAKRVSNAWIAAAVALALLPFIGFRAEVRPEIFGNLFAGVILWLLVRIRLGQTKTAWAWFIPPVMALWVNLHASFPIGLLLLGSFLLFDLTSILPQQANEFARFFGRIRRLKSPANHIDPIIAKDDRDVRSRLRTLVPVFALSLLASLLNPSLLQGALYPFQIFREVGYAVVENQSVMFLQEWGLQAPEFLILKICTGLLALLAIFLFTRHRSPAALPLLTTALIVTLMAWLSIRHFTLLGLVLIPTLSAGLAAAFTLLRRKLPRPAHWPAAAMTMLLLLSGGWALVRVQDRAIGLGVDGRQNAAAAFFKRENLRGPIVNNFDIAAYVIYHLFPGERVFTDNRPEANPVSFFRDAYIPMQQDEKVWRQQLAEYDFNALVFSYRDQTPWAQEFIKARLGDAAWAPVYADDAVLIMLRRTGPNADVIRRNELPKEMFRWN